MERLRLWQGRFDGTGRWKRISKEKSAVSYFCILLASYSLLSTYLTGSARSISKGANCYGMATQHTQPRSGLAWVRLGEDHIVIFGPLGHSHHGSYQLNSFTVSSLSKQYIHTCSAASKPRIRDHGFAGLCSWPLDRFEYRGLCSHSPPRDDVLRDLQLSLEQLEEIATCIKEKNKQYIYIYGRKLRANPKSWY